MKLGFIYAGQGQQFLNMGVDLASEFSWASDVFKQAQSILEYDLLDLIKNDEVKLNQTEYTQPALFVVNYLLGEYLIRNDINPKMVAGLSLGEYNALVCAKVLSFEDALKIIKVRAKIMSSAFAVGETKMAAVLKADEKVVNDVLADPTLNNEVAICNYNTYDQLVIGGKATTLTKAIEMLKDAGCKRVIELDVSCVSHMSLLDSASLKLKEELEKYSFNKPELDFINNIAASKQEDDFVYSLAYHISKPTYMAKTISLMIDEGIDTFIEVGPKKTISTFIKSVAKVKEKQVEIFNVYDLETLNETIKELGE